MSETVIYEIAFQISIIAFVGSAFIYYTVKQMEGLFKTSSCSSATLFKLNEMKNEGERNRLSECLSCLQAGICA